jgi:hypothetical protein
MDQPLALLSSIALPALFSERVLAFHREAAHW